MGARVVRSWVLVLGLVIFATVVAFAQTQETISIPYGDTKDYTLELNTGDTALLDVRVVDIPDANVSEIYVQYDSSSRDRVFCAPSPKTVSDDVEHFTCVVTPGDAFEGYVTFVALDANKSVLSESTKLHITVTYQEQWFSAKTIAKVGSTVSVGGQSVVVKSASFLYVTLLVDNSPVTAFVNDETEVASGLYVVYKGYDPDTREVYLEFKSHQPITASVQQVDYYLAAPRNAYYSDKNEVTVDVYTNCSAVEYRVVGEDDWKEVEVSKGTAEITLSDVVDRLYLRCADDQEVARVVHLYTPPVITVTPDENEFVAWCEGHGYITKNECPKTDCTAYCSANGWVRPPAGYECKFTKVGASEVDYGRLFVGLVILVALVVLAYLYKTGKIRLPRKKSAEDELEQPKPLEEAHDIQ